MCVRNIRTYDDLKVLLKTQQRSSQTCRVYKDLLPGLTSQDLAATANIDLPLRFIGLNRADLGFVRLIYYQELGYSGREKFKY